MTYLLQISDIKEQFNVIKTPVMHMYSQGKGWNH